MFSSCIHFTSYIFPLFLKALRFSSSIPADAKLESISINNNFVIGQYSSRLIGIGNLKLKISGAMVFFVQIKLIKSFFSQFLFISQDFVVRQGEFESINSQIRLQQGNKLLVCSKLKKTQSVGDGRSLFEFSLMDLEKGLDMRPDHLFQTNWTRSDIDFFDFDESHVVFNLKRSRSFMVHCITTGEKLWHLKPTLHARFSFPHGAPFIVLRDFQNGLLLADDSTGRIR